jgi:hypothetical protein
MDEDIFSVDACAAVLGASFEEALAAARMDDYEYLIYGGKIYDVATGVEAVAFL